MRRVLGMRGAISLTIGMIILSSCVDKMERVQICEDEIAFRAGTTIASKSILDHETFCTAGSILAVRDVYTPVGGGADQYWIDNEKIECRGLAHIIWPYTSGNKYYWTADGTHRFFGWLYKDASYPDANTADPIGRTIDEAYPPTAGGQGWNYDTNTKVLSIAEHALDPYYGWDFLYAKPLVKHPNIADDRTTVLMPLSHLYSAVAFCFKNDSNDPITFKEIHIDGVHNVASATISFIGAPTADGRDAEGIWTQNPHVGVYNFGQGGSVVYRFSPGRHYAFAELNPHLSQGAENNPTYIDLCTSPNGDFSEHTEEIKDYHLTWPQNENMLEEVTMTLKYSIEEHTSYERFRKLLPSDASGAVKYVVQEYENTIFSNSGIRGNYDKPTGAADDEFVWAGVGEGDYLVTFRLYEPNGLDRDLTPTLYVTDTPAEVINTFERNPTFSLKTPNTPSWEPGYKYYYLISHSSSNINVDVKVLKWEPHDMDVTFGGVFTDHPDIKQGLGLQ